MLIRDWALISFPTFIFVWYNTQEGGGGVLPYKGLMGMCGQPGILQGIEFIIFCLNQGSDLSIFVLNRISFLGR